MFNKKIKNLKIGQKILISIIVVSLIAQISAAVPTIINIFNISKNSQSELISLGNFTSHTSENALKNQAETYLKKVSDAMSDASDNIFEEVSDQTNSLSIAAQDIYRNPKKFNGHHTLPLPETTAKGNRSLRENASEKAYIVDPENTSENGESVLVYNTVSNKFSEKIYKTDAKTWENTTNEEKENLQKNKIVVSSNTAPQNLKDEICVISNLSHIAKCIYESNLSVSSVYAGTESGICYYYSSSNSSQRYDPRTRPWYIDAVAALKNKNNLPVWQSTYIGKSDGVPCITCSKAFMDSNGNILGTVAIDMYIDDINEYIIGSTIGNTGRVFVTDEKGTVIMHPDYNINSSEFQNTNFIKKPLESNETSDSYKNLISKMASGEHGVETALINGKNYYVAYSPMPTTKWSLGAACESQEILSPVSEIQNAISESVQNTENSMQKNLSTINIRFFIIFIICAMITYAIGIKLSNSISSPVKKLRNQAKIIGEGNFSSRIDINSDDELGDLSKSFNKMAENLSLYIENLKITTAEKEKIHSELMVAKRIQRSMLPCIFPAFPNRHDFDIYAVMDPAREVGGDFYDFFFTDKNHLALVIADVSGKGVSAALFMVTAKILIKNQLQTGDSPEKALEKVNKKLCENNNEGMFVTAFIGLIDIETGEFSFSNAGHNPPLIYKNRTHRYEFIHSPKGFVLGGMSDSKYSIDKIFLEREDSLFLYTDGVTEAMNPNGELFSKERLQNILNNPLNQKLKIADTIKHMRNEINKFADGAERADDITMLAFKNLNIPY